MGLKRLPDAVWRLATWACGEDWMTTGLTPGLEPLEGTVGPSQSGATS